MPRPPYEPVCCCYKDSPEWRNRPEHGVSPDDRITIAEIQPPQPVDTYLFRTNLSF